jgi:radical SAM protein with 4Fe4S-binding SPASM domain
MNYIKPDKVFSHPSHLKYWFYDECVKPITAEIHLSNKCNNACYYCGQKENRDSQEMTADDIIQTVDFLSSIGVKGTYFSGGGEPTLNDNLQLAIDLFTDKNIELGMITNGVIMDNQIIDYYLLNFKWVRISIDAADSETYKKIRGTDDYNIVIENVKKLLARKKELNSKTTIGLQIVVNDYNYYKLFYTGMELLNIFVDIDYLQIRPIEIKINEFPYDKKKQIKKIKHELLELEKLEKIIISDKWNLFFNDKREFGFTKCHASEFILTVDAHCDLYQCCHVIGNKDYKIGNIKDYNNNPVENFNIDRHYTISTFDNKKKGFNPVLCPLGCRGSGINKALENILNQEHKNFL